MKLVSLSLFILTYLLVNSVYSLPIPTTTTPIETATIPTTDRTENRYDDSKQKAGFPKQLITPLWIVAAFFFIFLSSAVIHEWRQSSYKMVISKMEARGQYLPARDTEGVEYGPDGRPNWVDRYGLYGVQEALDMINLTSYRELREFYNEETNKGLPLFAIPGQELETINHAFNHMSYKKRPKFQFWRYNSEGPLIPAQGVAGEPVCRPNCRKKIKFLNPYTKVQVRRRRARLLRRRNNCRKRCQKSNRPLATKKRGPEAFYNPGLPQSEIAPDLAREPAHVVIEMDDGYQTNSAVSSERLHTFTNPADIV